MEDDAAMPFDAIPTVAVLVVAFYVVLLAVGVFR
jgi:hypothetical protein